MDIVVKGRNVEVPDHFRVHVIDKLSRSERYDPKIIRVDVELSHETNRRQAKNCQRVQITLASRGPAVRAEASADSFYAALDGAVVKLESRLRRAADRRHDRLHARTSLAELTGAIAEPPVTVDPGSAATAAAASASATAAEVVDDFGGHEDHDPRWDLGGADGAHGADGAGAGIDGRAVDDDWVPQGRDDDDAGEPGRIVRIKSHPSEPITVTEALRRMELVGHDFYLFSDSESGVCSVVYRRRGFNYGLLRLDG